MQSLVLEIPKNIEKFKGKIARQEDKGKLEEPRNEREENHYRDESPLKSKKIKKKRGRGKARKKRKRWKRRRGGNVAENNQRNKGETTCE